MKNSKNVVFVLIALFFCTLTVKAQTSDEETETITGVFDGFDGEHFTFNYTNEEDEEDVVLFAKANSEVLKKFNLSNEKFMGKTFNITFITETETDVDEDGDEQEYDVRTIVDLELLD
ncbi:hypothetical protein U6A24_07660 [Aquimarina gracilis]|uniref:Uncharacterized protein n=1 Tax=Aquimarina gracilis TaxID=874422 RepID=A0ABU5ZTI6_9FLAO|nr:hypothetical protein [Aquimarina gracilis]MEB3345328.1 hypothetical protein [Aquimarina gracilis]